MAALQAFLVRHAAFLAHAYTDISSPPALSSAKKSDTWSEEDKAALEEAASQNKVPAGLLYEKLRRFYLLAQMIEQARVGNILAGGERMFEAKSGGWPEAYSAVMIVPKAMNFVSNTKNGRHCDQGVC